jgi:hypothetical protein
MEKVDPARMSFANDKGKLLLEVVDVGERVARRSSSVSKVLEKRVAFTAIPKDSEQP